MMNRKVLVGEAKIRRGAMMGARLVVLAVLLLCSGCIKNVAPAKILGGGEGEVYVYLEPFPQDAGRLDFTLAGVSALKTDGMEIPLDLRIRDFRSKNLRRQRLMAVGTVPAGDYNGFVFHVRSAKVQREDGDAALLVSEKPEPSPFRFDVKKKGATVVSLTFRFRESIKGGVGFAPAFAMEVPANPLPTLTGYVSNYGSHTVTVFDKREGRVAGVIETGRNPSGIAIDQTQMAAYVAVSGDDAIEVLDVMRNDIVGRIQLRPGDAPRDLALTPDGKTLISVNNGSNTVSFVDPSSQSEQARLTVGNDPRSILLDRNAKRAYVFNNLSNTISVIDIVNRSVSGSIGTETGPRRGEFNRKGDKLYICHSLSPYIVAIDPVSFAPLKKFNEGMGVTALKVNPFNDLLYVGREDDGQLEIFDPMSFIPGDFLNTSGGVGYLTVDGDENNLIVVHPAERTVQLLNLTSKKQAALMDVGDDPYRVAVFGER